MEKQKGSYKKWTHEEVKKLFEERGYELLESEYVNHRHKMRYRCPEHPKENTTMNMTQLKSGQRCPFCVFGNKKHLKRIPLSYEEVEMEFKQRGYILLDKTYKNNKTKMKFICPKHPDKENALALYHLKRGHECRYCGREKARKQWLATDIESVKEEFKKRGYFLLENEYVNNKEKMKYHCPEHPEEELYTTYSRFTKGSGCPHCAFENFRGENNPMWNGGVTEISMHLRRQLNDWKQKSLYKYNYKCAITGDKKNLEVHHVIPFKKVRDEVLLKLGIDFHLLVSECSNEELDVITKEFLKAHNKVLGVPLRKDIHKHFHSLYGLQPTLSDLYEYKARYNTGEFEGLSIEKQLTLII